MSFRINTNISAMSALMNLNHNNDMFNQSITRLSTGLRINSAADDPAGLIISEQFKAQIGGLNQAVLNNQDGINYAKTAEGALDEVNKLLNDARSLAVASGNSAVLSAAEIQANQSQLQSIVNSITRIAQTTQFGTKKLLDGSAGTSAAITAGTVVSSLNIGGTFNGTSLSTNSAVTLAVTAAATQANINITNAAFTAGTSLVAAGSFTINGVTFTTTSIQSVAQVVNTINQASAQTGVTAVFNAGATQVQLFSTGYGSSSKINVADANGVLYTTSNSGSASGTDATANVTINGTTVAFTGGKNGHDGLTLSDTDGNSVRLTAAGNVVAAGAIVGQVTVGSAQFQVGANANQTVNLSLSNYAATQLGTTAVAGQNLSTIDFNTASNATTALKVIDAAIDQISSARGQIGSFQRNVLESNIRSLGVEKQNLSATLSAIQDTDVAAEMTNFTKEQILQQAGMSVLAQANQSPQLVLKLLG